MRINSRTFARTSSLMIVMLFIFLAVVGGVRAYSPVPFSDMWDGVLGFYLRVQQQDASAWWYQHNEHRIVLSRVLFWIDYRFFDGLGVFLLCVNYVLILGVAFFFAKITHDSACANGNRLLAFPVAALVASWVVQWMQYENITWAFQSQFFLAQLLPVLSLIQLHRSSSGNGQAPAFILACALGVASAGTMANGVITLALMTGYAIWNRFQKFRVMTLAALASIVLVAYFYKYRSPPAHGSLIKAIMGHPFVLTHYLVLYLGNPFYHLFRDFGWANFAAAGAGAGFLAIAVFSIFHGFMEKRSSSIRAVFLFYLMFLLCGAIATAGGRSNFGVDQALSSRYTTPVLMAWASMVIIHLRSLMRLVLSYPRLTGVCSALLLILMLKSQWSALRPNRDDLFQRRVSALALELGVQDRPQIKKVFPGPDVAQEIADQARKAGLTVFGLEPLVGLRVGLGQARPASRRLGCVAALDSVNIIEDDDRFLSVKGWIYSQDENASPVRLELLDSAGLVVGYALTGQPRPDVAGELKTKYAIGSGFSGYVLKQAAGHVISLQGSDVPCSVEFALPSVFFELKKSGLISQAITVSVDQVLSQGEWVGADFQKTSMNGIRVMGSHIFGDQDTGRITLRGQGRFDIFYRSGPTGGRQTLKIGSGPTVVLPVCLDWTLIRVNLEGGYKNDYVVLEFSDGGGGWGEWSAIAVRDDQ